MFLSCPKLFLSNFYTFRFWLENMGFNCLFTKSWGGRSQDSKEFDKFESLLFIKITMRKLWTMVWNDFIANRIFKIVLTRHSDFFNIQNIMIIMFKWNVVYEALIFLSVTLKTVFLLFFLRIIIDFYFFKEFFFFTTSWWKVQVLPKKT